MYLPISQLMASQIHPVVVDWVGRIFANSGTIGEKSVSAVNRFWTTLTQNNLTGKCKCLNPFIPDSLSGMMVPLVSISGSGNWINSGFTSGDLTISGLIGNGTTKYVNTQFYPGHVIGSGDGGFIAYVTVDVKANVNEAGCTDAGGANAMRLYCHYGDNNTYYNMYGPNINTIITTGTLVGYLGGFRTANTSFTAYHAAAASGHLVKITSAVSSTPVPSKVRPMYVFATNEGTTANFSAKRLSFFAITNGLSSGESLIMYNAIQQLRMDFGGGYV